MSLQVAADEGLLAQAWALKADCYAAWHSVPARTRIAADAVATLAAAHAGCVELEALAFWTDGIALLAEGRLNPALERLRQAQQAFSNLGDEQHAAQTQVPQMGALMFLGRDAELIEIGREALGKFVAIGDQRAAGKVEINLGTSLARQDRHVEAEQAYRNAAARFDGLGDAELSTMAELGLANALTWQFRSSEALRIAAHARRRARQAGHDILHAQTWQATGQIELNRGHLGAALAALAKAVRLHDRSGAAPQRRIECEIALADAYASVRLVEEALLLYERAIREADALPAPNECALATLQRARLLARCGRYDAALQGLTEARKRYVELGNGASAALADLSLARVQVALNRPIEAHDTASRTMEVLERTGIRGWWLEACLIRAAALAVEGSFELAKSAYADTLAAGSDLAQVAFECHAGLGALALARGDLSEARKELELSLLRMDLERQSLAVDELRSALAVQATVAHETLISTSLAQEDANRLLLDIDRGRSRALALAIDEPKGPTAWARRHSRLQQLRQAWRQSMMANDASQLQVLDGEIVRAEHALLEQHRRVDLQASRRGSGRPLQQPVAGLDLQALGGALGIGRAMVIFHWRETRLLTLVVGEGGVSFVETSSEHLAERIAGLRFQVEAMRNPVMASRHRSMLEHRLLSHARALHEQVWAPVRALIGQCDNVVIVPHGPLHDLPFALLHDGRHWLAQRSRLTLAPSASIWLALHGKPACTALPRVVVAGAPGLAHVGREIDEVARVYGPAALVLRGKDCTSAKLRSATGRGVDILHLACHACFRADNPAFSTLQLADGPLPMHELARWRLPASLVVLSACETGVSHVSPGEEAFGLVRAVLLAGARAVLATQWAVDDAATAKLLSQLHVLLKNGEPPDAALRNVQAEAADGGLHPYYWGAFGLHGAG